MNEAVFVPAVLMLGSMIAIVVLGIVGGLLMGYLDKKAEHPVH